jgi:cytochrome c peroxidase
MEAITVESLLRYFALWGVGLIAAGLMSVAPGRADADACTPSACFQIPLGLDTYMPIPEENALTRQKVALGKMLFSERMLSRDRSLSCISCHDPDRIFTDGRQVSRGINGREGTRNAPTLINRGYGVSFFWDGRARSLEEQVLQPIENPLELDLTLAEAVNRLSDRSTYRRRFQLAFGRQVEAQDLARALASYVRTILSGNSPYDRYLNGERDALSVQARKGLQIFRGKGNCTACHLGPSLTDERFHNTGVAWRNDRVLDEGRFEVTGMNEHRGAFKTPTLREIDLTPPYMHDGSLNSLEEVIDFYSRGGNPNPFLDPEVRPINLTEGEKADLLAFLSVQQGVVQDGLSASAE